jgi:hypothetical protein
MDYLLDYCRRRGLLVGTAALYHLCWAERCPDRQFHSPFCLAWLDLDRNLSWLSLFREMARALAAHSGAVCTVLACHVDFRWSRLQLAWALQLIDRRGWVQSLASRPPIDDVFESPERLAQRLRSRSLQSPQPIHAGARITACAPARAAAVFVGAVPERSKQIALRAPRKIVAFILR